MLVRVKVALRSPDGITRLLHFIFSAVFFRMPKSLRRAIFAGKEHYCILCESHLSCFLVLHRDYYLWCPVCRSFQRPRLGWIYLVKENLLDPLPKRMLHIGPEPALGSRLLQLEGLDYISADLDDRKAMVKMDICDIQYPNNTFDLIYCSHVLEHVQDDRRAMREFWRVLKPEGRAIIMVPITAQATIENLPITDPLERERLFGQFDHMRRYGLDFEDRLEDAGFKVEIIKTEDIVDIDQVSYLGVSTDEIIFFCQK